MRNARKEVANLYKSLMVDANQLLTALKRLFNPEMTLTAKE